MPSAEEVVSEFVAAMADAGVPTSATIRPDGSLNRFHVEGDRRGTKNGWAILYLDDHPAGVFGRWNTQLKATWSHRGAAISAERQAEWAAQVEAMRQARESERRGRADAAAEAAQREWSNAAPAWPIHPYLVRKGVPGIRLRQSGNALLVPMRNALGAIRGLQRIYPDGSKRFTAGMGKAGTYFSLGRVGPTLVICEGVATGLSIYMATGLPVACAMDAGNLPLVAKALAEKLPGTTFIVAADNDDAGMEAGRSAAFVVGGAVMLTPGLDPGEGKDWNDAVAAWGMHAVRTLFAEARS